jgi:predicted transcriptional regulator
MIRDGLVISDVEQGRGHYRTTPKGMEYLAALNSMCELLQIETKIT